MNAIKKLRERMKITQDEIAKELGVTQGAVSKWEVDETAPSADKLPALARILHCKIDELFEQ